jgi:hypothetical protein
LQLDERRCRLVASQIYRRASCGLIILSLAWIGSWSAIADSTVAEQAHLVQQLDLSGSG